jgi:gliding motility-associated lipoprotein GldH
MKRLFLISGFLLLIVSCDPARVYDKNEEFSNRNWPVDQTPEFQFDIDNADISYDLYVNVRNEVSYTNANLYFTYYLMDTLGNVFEKKLVSEFLFDKKTGKPFGNSVLGDIYDHRIPILKKYVFKNPGRYVMRYEHFMRTDSLAGILGVGLRIEKSNP